VATLSAWLSFSHLTSSTSEREAYLDTPRRAIDLVNSGDFPSAIADTDDDFQVDRSNSIGPLRGVYRGREEVTRFWESFHDAWDNLRWDIQEALDLGGGRVRLLRKFSP
jgi:hypothetical protein